MGSKHIVLIFLAAVAVGLVGVYFFVPLRQEAHDPLARYQAALRADTQGGKTPEETLRLFISALRAGDVDLASKYFMLDDTLSREKWTSAVYTAKKENRLEAITDLLEKSIKSLPDESAYDTDAKFFLYGENNKKIGIVDMEFNTLSGVWKLQSF